MPVKKKATPTASTPKKTAPAKAKPAAKPKASAAKKPAAKTASKPKAAKAVAPQATTSAVEGFHRFVPYEPGKNEEYMSGGMLEHFRNILIAWKQELMEEVDRTVHHMKDEAANFPDPNDRATQESEFTLELRTRDRERKLLKKIEESIEAIDSHEYGYCEQCGVEIGLRRLEARPTATQCIECKTIDEIRERQRG